MAKQQAKLAQSQSQSQPAQPAPARHRPRRPRTPDPLAEHARLLAAGEKLLAKQDAAKAKEAARIEADLAKRQGAREREAQQRWYKQERSERDQKRQQRDSTKQELKDEADRHNREIATEAAELEAVLRERPDDLEDWHPLLERAFAHDGANGVAEVVEDLLRRSPLPPGCRDSAVVGYAPESAQLLVDIGLPSQDVVPTVAGYRFVAQRAEIIPQLVKEADHQETYRRLLARLALWALDEAFSVTLPQMVDTILLNGHVATTDPATGQAVRPCVVVERADFAELTLPETGVCGGVGLYDYRPLRLARRRPGAGRRLLRSSRWTSAHHPRRSFGRQFLLIRRRLLTVEEGIQRGRDRTASPVAAPRRAVRHLPDPDNRLGSALLHIPPCGCLHRPVHWTVYPDDHRRALVGAADLRAGQNPDHPLR